MCRVINASSQSNLKATFDAVEFILMSTAGVFRVFYLILKIVKKTHCLQTTIKKAKLSLNNNN